MLAPEESLHCWPRQMTLGKQSDPAQIMSKPKNKYLLGVKGEEFNMRCTFEEQIHESITIPIFVLFDLFYFKITFIFNLERMLK